MFKLFLFLLHRFPVSVFLTCFNFFLVTFLYLKYEISQLYVIAFPCLYLYSHTPYSLIRSQNTQQSNIGHYFYSAIYGTIHNIAIVIDAVMQYESSSILHTTSDKVIHPSQNSASTAQFNILQSHFEL